MKLIAEIKRLHSPDVYDLATFAPDDPEDFGFLLQIMAGTLGSEGEESFNVVVCTPRWVSRHFGAGDCQEFCV